MVALFLDDNKTNNDGDGKKNGRKINCLYLQTTTFHVNHAIFYISLPSLHHYDIVTEVTRISVQPLYFRNHTPTVLYNQKYKEYEITKNLEISTK